ncbi:hypothetical protein LAZ67_2005603 [Cordylochernes scorpioides]|uniref:Uncharacterized protein n=1 Tax=Cordylochernes scorpioides TaxID=51811 RepID=A0ABY6K4Q9_9ARAC|nr:hypothetical protein LAZ67_2005603 [Cordylochernes scorpioides]
MRELSADATDSRKSTNVWTREYTRRYQVWVAHVLPRAWAVGKWNIPKISRTQVYFWYKRFKDGRKSIADDSRSGRPLTSTMDRNIEQGRDLIVADRKITIDNISEILGISYSSCKNIIVCGYCVPRNLKDQQREKISIYKDLIESTNNDSDFL